VLRALTALSPDHRACLHAGCRPRRSPRGSPAASSTTSRSRSRGHRVGLPQITSTRCRPATTSWSTPASRRRARATSFAVQVSGGEVDRAFPVPLVDQLAAARRRLGRRARQLADRPGPQLVRQQPSATCASPGAARPSSGRPSTASSTTSPRWSSCPRPPTTPASASPSRLALAVGLDGLELRRSDLPGESTDGAAAIRPARRGRRALRPPPRAPRPAPPVGRDRRGHQRPGAVDRRRRAPRQPAAPRGAPRRQAGSGCPRGQVTRPDAGARRRGPGQGRRRPRLRPAPHPRGRLRGQLPHGDEPARRCGTPSRTRSTWRAAGTARSPAT
jgi:hypothetical protein